MEAVELKPRRQRGPRKQGVNALADRIANLRINERRELAKLLKTSFPDEFACLTKAMAEATKDIAK